MGSPDSLDDFWKGAQLPGYLEHAKSYEAKHENHQKAGEI